LAAVGKTQARSRSFLVRIGRWARAKWGVNYPIRWAEIPSQPEAECPIVGGRTKGRCRRGDVRSWFMGGSRGVGIRRGETWLARAKGGFARPRRAMGGSAATPCYRAVSSVGATSAATRRRRGGGRMLPSSCVHGTRSRSRSTSDSGSSSRDSSDHLVVGRIGPGGAAPAEGARVVRRPSIEGAVTSTRAERTTAASHNRPAGSSRRAAELPAGGPAKDGSPEHAHR
jgi:hypothetical protein